MIKNNLGDVALIIVNNTNDLNHTSVEIFLYPLWEELQDKDGVSRRGFMHFSLPTNALTWTLGELNPEPFGLRRG